MEKNLKNVLLEMKRLMSYDRSLGNLITEQGSADITDNRRSKEQLSTSTVAVDKEGITYKQKFKTRKGYFDNEMMLGECFYIEEFTSSNANAYSAMDIPKDKIFKDNDGYYIKADTKDYGDNRKVKVYLPKDEFFKQFIGMVKSFIAYETCNDSRKRQGGKKYSLIYQLTNPEDAIVTQIIDSEGVKYTDTDVSRGWQISTFGGSESGYFRSKNQNDISVTPNTLINSTLPSDFVEYSLQNYGEEYGRSEFDIWYDSGWGTAIMIGGAILLSVMTGGIAGVLTAGMESALMARGITLAAELGAELVVGIPEAIYLAKRGNNAGATMVLIFSLLPLLNRSGLIKRASGTLSNKQQYELINQIYKNSDEFKTPGDIKSWIKSLDNKTRTFVEETLQQGSNALGKLDKDLLEKDIRDGLKRVIDDIKVNKVVTSAGNKEIVDVLKGFSNNKWSTALNLIGLNLGAVLATIPIIITAVEDDEDFKRDPQKILEKASENAQKILDKVSEKIKNDLNKKITELNSKLMSNPNDMDSAKEYLNILKDISYEDYHDYKSDIMKSFLQSAITDIKIEYLENKSKKQYSENQKLIQEFSSAIPGSDTEIWKSLLTDCTTTENTPFKTRDEACKFLDWVNTNHPEFTYNWGEYKKLVITPCSTEDRKIQPDWYLINDCEIKYAYSKYKSIYNNGE